VTEASQNAAGVTYAARLERRDGQIGFDQPALAIHNAIRGLQPWPLVWARLKGKRIALLASEALPREQAAAPAGTIVRVESDALVVAARAGAVRLTRVQLEGRPPVAIRDFLNGHPTTAGDRFESEAPSAP
jgi:methionyl-tRNA formyltransferase